MSDYDKTKRRITDEGIVQYSAGGSRVTNVPSSFGISKTGKIKTVEVFGKMPCVITDDNKLQAYKGHGDNPEEGIELPESQKVAVRQYSEDGTKYWHYGKWRSVNAPVKIGDTIQIIDESDPNYGETAIVRNVRSEAPSWRVACIMRTGKSPNVKFVYEGTQYAIKKKVGEITKDDYLLQGLSRSKKILQEDQ